MQLLITGSTGFVGRVLTNALSKKTPNMKDHSVSVALRSAQGSPETPFFVVGDFTTKTNWTAALAGQHVVIHCAARAHIMKDEIADPLAEYRRVNVDGTLNLAQQAVAAGVQRFVYISSIKVNGECTQASQRFKFDDAPMPEDPYGVSKLEAEVGLKQIAQESGMEVVIIRPPLVYGAGVKANFAALMRLARKNLPLPLGAINNQRSMVALDNLVDLIITCIDHPAAAGQTFLVSDDHDVSTTELLTMMTRASGKEPRLLPVPEGLLRLAATIVGKKAMADRLLGNLQVDITHTKEILGWKPPISLEEGIKRCFE